MKFLKTLFFITATISLSAQNPNDRLAAYFPFDKYPIEDKSGSRTTVVYSGDTTAALGCGVEGSALRMDGIRSQILMLGDINDVFKTGDFTISFYFKPFNQGGNATQDILSKRQNCGTDSVFAVRYTPATNTMSVEMGENNRNKHLIVQRLDFSRCWQHIVIVRAFDKLSLYVNGTLKATNRASKRINIDNRAPFAISASPCLGTTDKKFQGFIDELKIFRGSLSELQIASLNNRPDRIANRDTIIFIGTTVRLNLTNTCAQDFVWSPATDIDDFKAASPTISPTSSGEFVYRVAIKEQQCTALDSVRIKVIDPKDLACTQVFVPKAFTPNGDGLNDELFISNPYAIEELLAFEVLDGWGGLLFSTSDRFGKWDGTFNGKKLNPGVYLWKVRFRCKGQELSNFGSVTILK